MIILKRKVAGLNERALSRFTARARIAAGVLGKVNVLVTDNRELQSLNRRFRNKDAPTDVLSFPADGQASNELAGDIAISGEMAILNGSKLGHSAAEEVRILILHGVLHLAGYDHERDNGVMARKEQKLRRAFKLPVGLIERHVDGAVRVKRLKKLASSAAVPAAGVKASRPRTSGGSDHNSRPEARATVLPPAERK